MSARLDQAWCPTCREWTVLDAGRPCAWCDTILVRRRGGWKRPDRHLRSRISRHQALALHAAHCHGRSLRDLSRATYKALGYKTAPSCLEGIRAAFDREGLTSRTQPDATAHSNRARAGEAPKGLRNHRKETGSCSPPAK